MKVAAKRILDFDIENRPLAYLGPDYTTAEITAIAWAWTDKPKTIYCVLLGIDDPVVMLESFRLAYDLADIVTGHYIRGHDLPVINGAMLDYGLPLLGEKATQDTKIDLTGTKYVSLSQENLAAMFGIAQEKVHMSNAMWRAANRLTPEGIRITEKRVVADVKQHMALRQRLLDGGYLGNTVVWRP